MFEITRKSLQWGGRELTIETGKIARQADGAVIVTYGETQVLATAVGVKENDGTNDFFPLTVNYQEKAFAAGLMGSGLCFVKQGKYDKESFIFNVEKGMTEKGYNLEILSNDNVQKAARLIESQLGNDCKESNLKDKKFLIEVSEILK